jgi:hypothetical protein
MNVKPFDDNQLNPVQLNAIDHLAIGKNARETADLLGVHRNTIIRWRLHDPAFKAALADRRREIWGGTLDRLRSAIPMAVDYLVRNIENPYTDWGLRAAAILLRTLHDSVLKPKPMEKEDDEIARVQDGSPESKHDDPQVNNFHLLEERLKARAKANPEFDDPAIFADLRKLYEEYGKKTFLSDDVVSLDRVIDALLEVRCREALTTISREQSNQ